MTPATFTLKAEIEALQSLAGRVEALATSAAQIIGRVDGRVITTGMGKAGIVALKVAATLRSTGQPSQYLDPAQAAHGDMGAICEGDCVLGFSNSGETDEVVKVFMFATDMRLPKIVVTAGGMSPLARLADLAIIYPKLDEGCPVGRAPMASCLQQLAVGDIIAADLMQQRGFTEADFLRFHHGGYLGRDIAALEMLRAKG